MELNFPQAAHILLTHYKAIQPKAGADQPDQRFDRGDLVDLSTQEHVPTDLKAAAEYLAQPDQFARLEVSAGILPEDGYAGKLDVTVAASQRLSYDEAVDIVAAHGHILDGAASRVNGEFGQADLQAVLNHQETPADLGEAAVYFLSNPRDFERLAFAARQGNPSDGQVGAADIHAAQVQRYYASHPLY